MTVSLYRRLLSDKQETSLLQQEDALRSLCDQQGSSIFALYKIDGISLCADKAVSRWAGRHPGAIITAGPAAVRE